MSFTTNKSLTSLLTANLHAFGFKQSFPNEPITKKAAGGVHFDVKINSLLIISYKIASVDTKT